MYQVNYYITKNPIQYGYEFKSLWAAIFKARSIFEEHGFATDVMNAYTGEIVAIFETNNIWVDNDLETDLHVLALTPLE